MTAEHSRLANIGNEWRKWGPYLSERQWGTARENLSLQGSAWYDFTFDQSRSRAYQWGEDGIAGISDDQQRLCFGISMWNGVDPIIKERLFGLTEEEGNHGEDVKECYYYLDSTPTHSYMRYLYKYPQEGFPYEELLEVNQQRGVDEPEYELLDTGIFDGRRYFDVIVEYAKAGPEDILICIEVHNHAPETERLHLIPTLWFRNTWSWGGYEKKPRLRAKKSRYSPPHIAAEHPTLGRYVLYCDGEPELWFTENETNREWIARESNPSPYVKDAFHGYLVYGNKQSINPAQVGTKSAAHYALHIPAGQSATVKLRLCATSDDRLRDTTARVFGEDFNQVLRRRRKEADEFYQKVTPANFDADKALVFRQAIANLLWNKQFYYYDLARWIEDRRTARRRTEWQRIPNYNWPTLYYADVISMSDKWEYPRYSAWELAFNSLAISLVDPAFAKEQISIILRESCLHPSGRTPSADDNFDALHPPVHAWSALFQYRLEQGSGTPPDYAWLEKIFQRLLPDFTWWASQRDSEGRTYFEGGFPGVDPVTPFDFVRHDPQGGTLEQAEGIAWMALYCGTMLAMSAELTQVEPSYEEHVLKFAQYFLMVASSMYVRESGLPMWNEEDGFFYDVLRTPDGTVQQIKVRSFIGLLPLCAATSLNTRLLDGRKDLYARFLNFLNTHPGITTHVHNPRKRGPSGRFLASILNEDSLRRILSVMLDEDEFLSPFGIRSLSKRHADEPYELDLGGLRETIHYAPGIPEGAHARENTNWRGPVWFPVNILILRALVHYHSYYGDTFTVECPTGSGRQMNLFEVARELARRQTSLFLKNDAGERPIYGSEQRFRDDPNWQDCLKFYEYFDAETGRGLGACHFAGWTGVVSRMMHLFSTVSSDDVFSKDAESWLQKNDTSASPEPEENAE